LGVDEADAGHRDAADDRRLDAMDAYGGGEA
jgi:hypothetical protein